MERQDSPAFFILRLFLAPLLVFLLTEGAVAGYQEQDLLTEIPRYVTATRMAQSRAETPAAITVIDREMIRASGAQEISDLFRLVPGFQAWHVNGHKFGVTTHGLGTTHPGRLEVMINGRSAYLSAMSTTDWRALGISLEDIERIEVVRGSNVVSWGSNAFLGAINIITRDPVGGGDAEATLVAGERGRLRGSAAVDVAAGDQAVRLAGGYFDGPGFSEADSGSGGHLNLHALVTPGLSDRIDLQFSVSGGQFGVGDRFERQLNRRDYLSQSQHLRWQHDWSEERSWSLNLLHHFQRYRMQERLWSDFLGLSPADLDSLGIPDEYAVVTPEHGDLERFDFELTESLTPAPGWRLLWGGGFRQDGIRAPLVLNRSGMVTEHFRRLFANLEWQPHHHWALNLGLAAESSDTMNTRLSPRAAVNYRLGNGAVLRAIAGRAWRPPSLLEAQQDTRFTHSNGTLILWRRGVAPDLSGERIDTLEAGLYWPWGERNSLDLRLFEERVEDGIGRLAATHNEPQALDLQWLTLNSNTARWRTRGLELELDLRPDAGTLLGLRYSYLDLKDFAPGAYAQPDTGEVLDLADTVPRHLVSLLASRTFGAGWQISGAFYHVPRVDWIYGTPTPAYNRVDLRLARTARLAGGWLETALSLQNLGETYQEFQSRNQFDTRAFLSLSWRPR